MSPKHGQKKRIIFPCLHQDSAQPICRHRQINRTQCTPLAGGESDVPRNFVPYAAVVQTQHQSLLRSNSLPREGLPESCSDGIYTPLPTPLSSLRPSDLDPFRVRDSVFDCDISGIGELTLTPSPNTLRKVHVESKKFPPVIPLSENPTTPRKSIFNGAANQIKTYYPAATTPKFHEPQKKSSVIIPSTSSGSGSQSKSRQLKSILRRKRYNSSPSKHRYSNLKGEDTNPSLRPPLTSPNVGVAQSSSLSAMVSAPTLASPKSIRSLNNLHDNPGTELRPDGDVLLGQTEYTLENISDTPKVLQRDSEESKKLRRNSSDTVVVKSEEENRQRHRRASLLKNSSGEEPEHEIIANDRVESFHDSGQDSLVSSRDSSRHHSLECLTSNKNVSFDPHVWVYEYQPSLYESNSEDKWFTEEELTQFKNDAIKRIRQRSMKMIPTGTGRMVSLVKEGNSAKDIVAAADVSKSVCYSHPALSCDDDFDPDGSSRSLLSKDNLIQDALSREIRNILVVDPHEIFLTLFTKSLKYMIPHVCVATARSGEEALARIHAAQKAFPTSDGGAVHGFDIIIVEERLQKLPRELSSGSGDEDGVCNGESTQTAGDDSIQRPPKLTLGSTLLRSIAMEENELLRECRGRDFPRVSLLIGVSACLERDRERIKQHGADFAWGKPPPEMNSKLRNELLMTLLKKRNKDRIDH
mmetsp:Transcript_23265/g.46589  ORF Transcript_23265/g.46589 Transcript_23265/m.46589 type:complete len:696 (-) Transcript_23265:71-2158(-)